jgi:hypothetical protein
MQDMEEEDPGLKFASSFLGIYISQLCHGF